MKWYDHLYVGESVRHPGRIKWKISHNAGTINIYVIAFASGEKNLLDIIPSWVLKQKGYPFKKQLHIIGIAKGYGEASELVRMIIDDTYQATGSVDVRSYLMFSEEHSSQRRE